MDQPILTMTSPFSFGLLLLIIGGSMAFFIPPFSRNDPRFIGPQRRFESFHHGHHDHFGHHGRFRRQYFGGGGMGMMGGMGGGMGQYGGMGGGYGGGNNLGMMAASMGGQFPGVVQSNMNSWGSFKSQREGGFNNQQQSMIMG